MVVGDNVTVGGRQSRGESGRARLTISRYQEGQIGGSRWVSGMEPVNDRSIVGSMLRWGPFLGIHLGLHGYGDVFYEGRPIPSL